MTANVEVYSGAMCPYCDRAKQLLRAKGVAFTEHRVDTDDALRQEMMERSQRRTIPQIFINGQAIGGYDDLYKLDQDGELDGLLENTD